MRETYCGKSCQSCTQRGETACMGCTGEVRQACKLAQCCQEKGYDSCESCSFHTTCGAYQNKDTNLQYRMAKKRAELEHEEFLKRRGAFLSKHLWILFWLFIPMNIAGVVTEWIPTLYVVGNVLGFVCMVVYGVVLLKMASEEEGYRRAGWLMLGTAVLNIPMMLLQNEIATSLLSIVSLGIGLAGSYYEFNAHSDVLQGVDDELSEQWRKLIKWLMGATLAMVIGLIFALVMVGLFVVLAASVVIIGVAVFELIYLYRTAQVFQDIAAR